MISREKFADLALKFIGYPSIHYQNPDVGRDANGFDCSGFVHFVLKNLNFPDIEKIRHTNEFFDSFGVFIHPEFADKGDLVFFSRDGCVPRHIGILLSRSSYIHAPGNNNTTVTVSTLEENLIKSSLAKQIYFRNPIGFKRLAIKVGRYQQVLD